MLPQLLRATLLIFRAQLWRTLKSRRTLVCAALGSLPVLVAFGIMLFVEGGNPRLARQTAGQQIAWTLVIQGLVPILSLIAGAAVISEEIEDRTITYLLTRPTPRAAILFGRWAAAFIWLSLLVTASLTGVLTLLDVPILDETSGMSPARLYGVMVAVGVLGCGVYSAGFAALGSRIKHPMIVGLAYTFAIEVFLTSLPGKASAITVQYYLRSIALEWAQPYVEVIEGFRAKDYDSGEVALLKLGIVLVVALAAGAWTLSRRQYVMSS